MHHFARAGKGCERPQRYPYQLGNINDFIAGPGHRACLTIVVQQLLQSVLHDCGCCYREFQTILLLFYVVDWAWPRGSASSSRQPFRTLAE